MPKFNQEIEARIQNAIRALEIQEKPNISKTAREFNVNVRTLNARFRGRPSLKDRAPTNRKLTDEQDKTIIQYIETLEGFLIRPLPQMIVDAANSVLKADHSDPTTPPLPSAING
jgi:hypothetical protein